MNRRSFVQQSMLGILGTAPLLPPPQNWQRWLTTVMKTCQVKSVSERFGLSAAQLNATEATLAKPTLQCFEKKAYSSGVYTGHFFRIFPQIHSQYGLLNFAIPFWAQHAGGEWTHFTTLSVFEIEALAHACESPVFKEIEKSYADYLLPVRFPEESAPSAHGFYRTKKGSVHCLTKVGRNKETTTCIKVQTKAGFHWESEFASQYRIHTPFHLLTA